MTRAQRQRRRAGATLAVSALVHVVVLGLLARDTPAFHPLWAPVRDFQVDLVPAAPLASPPGQAKPAGAPQPAPTMTPRTPPRPAHHTNVQTTTPYPLPARSAAQTPRPPSLPVLTPRPPPTPLTSRPQAGTGPTGPLAGVAGAAGAVQLPQNGSGGEGDPYGARFRGALRTSVGCDDPDFYNLTKAERAICLHQIGVQAAIGAKQYVDPISSAKVRDYYDAVKAAHDAVQSYNPVSGGPMRGGVSFGCKYGKCGINPPHGMGTEELGIPRRDRTRFPKRI